MGVLIGVLLVSLSALSLFIGASSDVSLTDGVNADGHREILGLQVAFDRREEIAADLFAVELTHDLDAAAELMRFLDEHVTRPLPAGRFARAVTCLERRWFATHPPALARLAAMRRRLAEHPER